MRDLLAGDGSIYVHCDDRVNGFLKIVLSEIFGPDRFVNEIIWQRTNAHNMEGRYFARVHDTIFSIRNPPNTSGIGNTATSVKIN